MESQQQRENWEITNTKDQTGLYALKRKAWEWRDEECIKSFSVAILFHEIHEYKKQYIFVRNGISMAILNKATARINNLSLIDKKDIKIVEKDYLA